MLLKSLQNHFADSRANVRESALETFFTLVKTFHSLFAPALKTHVLEARFTALVEALQTMDSAILAIPGVVQCLRTFGDCESVMDSIALAIETLSKPEGPTAGDALLRSAIRVRTRGSLEAGVGCVPAHVPRFWTQSGQLLKIVTAFWKNVRYSLSIFERITWQSRTRASMSFPPTKRPISDSC
jgi:hypothetical protein